MGSDSKYIYSYSSLLRNLGSMYSRDFISPDRDCDSSLEHNHYVDSTSEKETDRPIMTQIRSGLNVEHLAHSDMTILLQVLLLFNIFDQSPLVLLAELRRTSLSNRIVAPGGYHLLGSHRLHFGPAEQCVRASRGTQILSLLFRCTAGIRIGGSGYLS